MKKIATYNGYNYYIGKDNKGTFYNIVPTSQNAPSTGYNSMDYITKVKNLPNLFLITPNEIVRLKKAIKELLTDINATFDSQARNNTYLLEIAKKCNTTTQVIFDSFN